MKKRMLNGVMIAGTIVLALLLIGLSTATYAWFSASNRVNLTDISFTADSVSGETELALGWKPRPEGSELDLSGALGNLVKPMIPVKALAPGETNGAALTEAAGMFNTSVEETGEDGKTRYKADGAKCLPYVFSNPDDASEDRVYVRNLNKSRAQRVYVACRPSEDLADKLVVATFAAETAEPSGPEDYAYRGCSVGAKAEETDAEGNVEAVPVVYYADIESGTEVNASKSGYTTLGVYSHLGAGAAVADEYDGPSFSVPADGEVCVKIAVWFDGVGMKDEHLGKTAKLNICFTGAYE